MTVSPGSACSGESNSRTPCFKNRSTTWRLWMMGPSVAVLFPRRTLSFTISTARSTPKQNPAVFANMICIAISAQSVNSAQQLVRLLLILVMCPAVALRHLIRLPENDVHRTPRRLLRVINTGTSGASASTAMRTAPVFARTCLFLLQRVPSTKTIICSPSLSACTPS